MKWLLKRLLVICLMIGVLCTAAVVVGRLDHSPSKLQISGIDICDGQPCFREIKVGSDWATILKMFPKGTMNQNRFDVQLDPIVQLTLQASADNKTIDLIWIYSEDPQSGPLGLTAADLITKFGIPCRVSVGFDKYDNGYVGFVYPTISFSLNTQAGNANGTGDYRIEWSSPVQGIFISTKSPYGTCNDDLLVNFGPWRGFRALEEYRQDNLNDVRINP